MDEQLDGVPPVEEPVRLVVRLRPEHVRRAMLGPRPLPVPLAIGAVGLLLLLAQVVDGDLDLLVAVPSAIVVLGAIPTLLDALVFAPRRLATSGGAVASWRVDSRGIAVTSAYGDSDVTWDQQRRVVGTRHLVLFLLGGPGSFILPREGVAETDLARIEGWARAAGVRVQGRVSAGGGLPPVPGAVPAGRGDLVDPAAGLPERADLDAPSGAGSRGPAGGRPDAVRMRVDLTLAEVRGVLLSGAQVRVLIGVAGVFVVLGAVRMLLAPSAGAALLLALGAFAGYLVAVRLPRAVLPRVSGYDWTVGPDGLRITGRGTDSTVEWTSLRRVVVTPEMVRLVHQNRVVTPIPRRSLPDEDLARVLAWARATGVEVEGTPVESSEG